MIITACATLWPLLRENWYINKIVSIYIKVDGLAPLLILCLYLYYQVTSEGISPGNPIKFYMKIKGVVPGRGTV